MERRGDIEDLYEIFIPRTRNTPSNLYPLVGTSAAWLRHRVDGFRAQLVSAEISMQRGTLDRETAHNLTIAALGIVYGDIGTSPLYAIRQSLLAFDDTSEHAILGALSLIFWS